ncbi:MAG: hypothetical protein SynsKO_11700 [Synoicihabitans sp.]
MAIHYHVWFHFKPEIGDLAGLEIANRFLAEMRGRGVRSRLMKNRGDAAKSKLDRFHASFEFDTQEQMNAAFEKKTNEGIHTGPHGELIRAVGAFHVEVFDDLENEL